MSAFTWDCEGVRRDYDATADQYRAHVADELAGKPFDRELLNALAARRQPPAVIADVGCGPGHVAAWLASRGAGVVGFDLSPAMIAQARRLNPGLSFAVADMTALGDDGPRFDAIVAFYSLIHFDDAALLNALASLRRALTAGGELVAAVHMGEGVLRPDDLWGVPVSLGFRLFSDGELESLFVQAGFKVTASVAREPYPGVEHPSRRLYLTAAPDAAG